MKPVVDSWRTNRRTDSCPPVPEDLNPPEQTRASSLVVSNSIAPFSVIFPKKVETDVSQLILWISEHSSGNTPSTH